MQDTCCSVPHRLSTLTAFIGGSFFLHLLWESLQAPLYEGYSSFGQHFWICLKATVTGDMFFMFVIYTTLAIVYRDLFWIADRSSYIHPATWVISILIGGLLAVSFEFWAVYVDHRWQYTDLMPIIPILQIGVTPILQMVFIPILMIFLSSRFVPRL